MCHKNHCIHTTYLKKRQKEDEPPEFLDDYFKIKPSTEHAKTKDAVSKKQIPFDVPLHMKHTTQSPNVYLPKFGELFLCTDDDELCRADCGGALMTSSSFYDVPLYCKGYSIMCRVKTKECELCHKVWDYDGGCQSILNMEKFLVHHSLLRDYMYHFLHSNSCTLHGYYQIMVKEHSDAGRTLERFRYNDLRSSWYAFLNLLSISFEDGAKCGQCGKIPDIVVCDATGMGYQRKFLTAGLSDSGNQFVHKRYSKHEDRIAISEQNIRKRTKKWVDAKLTKFQSNSLILEMRTKYRTIYNIMKWSLDTYTNVKKFPKSLKKYFSATCIHVTGMFLYRAI
ncbi:uncharacterized protein [Clytia hemisphaerica]|uniref:uncharacterized protein n=1 Tax=Clytia hemisphaerica TaxID=252671 RepID=UPI0034D54D5E